MSQLLFTMLLSLIFSSHLLASQTHSPASHVANTTIDLSEHKDLITYSVGKGKKDIWLFTNPNCPHCVKVDKRLDAIAKEHDITIHIILYPYTHNNFSAEGKSIYILDQPQEMRAKAFTAIAGDANKEREWRYYGGSFASEKILKAQKALAKKVGVSGTPFFCDKNAERTFY